MSAAGATTDTNTTATTQTTGATGADTGAKTTADTGSQASAGADTKATGDTSATATGAAQGKSGASILDGGLKADAKATEDANDPAARAAAKNWPDDWREQMAGGDESALKLLKRYASPATFAKAAQGLRSRLDSGEFKKPLPADATPDEVTAWRKDNGIPEKADGYEMPKGLTIGEADKPVIDDFLKFAHEGNKSPADVQGMISWYFQNREAQNQRQYEADQQFKAEAEDTLRQEYGNEFRGNVNGLTAFLKNKFGDEVGAALMNARLSDGTLFAYNPAVIKPLVQLMREIDPSATVTLPAGQYGGKGVDAQIAEYEASMAKDINAWQATSNQKNQDHYMELLRTREKIQARDGRAAA